MPTRSALHRCLQRHGISRLPKAEDGTSKRRAFKETEIGYVHIDSCELRCAEGKLHMFLAVAQRPAGGMPGGAGLATG